MLVGNGTSTGSVSAGSVSTGSFSVPNTASISNYEVQFGDVNYGGAAFNVYGDSGEHIGLSEHIGNDELTLSFANPSLAETPPSIHLTEDSNSGITSTEIVSDKLLFNGSPVRPTVIIYFGPNGLYKDAALTTLYTTGDYENDIVGT